MLKLICNTCALNLGAHQALAGTIAWNVYEAIPCDNCGRTGMLKSLEAYEINIPDYLQKALEENRLTRKALVRISSQGGMNTWMVEDLGQQVWDPFIALLQERQDMLERMIRTRNGN